GVRSGAPDLVVRKEGADERPAAPDGTAVVDGQRGSPHRGANGVPRAQEPGEAGALLTGGEPRRDGVDVRDVGDAADLLLVGRALPRVGRQAAARVYARRARAGETGAADRVGAVGMAHDV